MKLESLKAGLSELDTLSKKEYRQNLAEILDSGDDDDTKIMRVGRLIGVELKRPLARPRKHKNPSPVTRAYRDWNLLKQKTFAKKHDTWQYKTLEYLLNEEKVRNDLESMLLPMNVYSVATAAHGERGFWGYLAKVCQEYICQDNELRRKIEENIENVKKAGINIELASPEKIIGAGGLILGGLLINSIPILGFVGAPVIAGIILLIYKLGIEAFCRWSKEKGESNAYPENTG